MVSVTFQFFIVFMMLRFVYVEQSFCGACRMVQRLDDTIFSISYGVRNLKSLLWIQPISFPYEKEVIVSISVLKCEFLVDSSELDRILIHTLNFASKFFLLVCIVSVEYLYHAINKYA